MSSSYRVIRALVLGVGLSVAACASPNEPSSAPPSDVPTPEVTFNAAYGEFTARIQGARGRYAILIQDLATASAGTSEEVGRAGEALAAFGLAEVTWWEAHAADPCYGEAFQAYGEAAGDAWSAGLAFAGFATAPEPPTEAETQDAVALLGAATDGFASAASLAAIARIDCQ
ncbi:MAG TPA: hypothetical protein VFR14_01465 [Candidatus Limnocylindrales bacterium]|nr:hypothetical protein [Candidatus Limnocylindrales bacterium]